MVGSSERALRNKTAANVEPRDGGDAGYFKGFVVQEGRQDARQATGNHGLPRTRSADEEDVVAARSRDFDGAARKGLTADLRKVGETTLADGGP